MAPGGSAGPPSIRATSAVGPGLSFGRPFRPGTVRLPLDRAAERADANPFGPVRAFVEEESPWSPRVSGCCRCSRRRSSSSVPVRTPPPRAVRRPRAARLPPATCAGDRDAGGATDLQIPDVVAGKFNVAMVLIGPHNDNGWSQAHYEGLQYLCENMPGRACRLHRARPRRRRLRAGLPQPVAQGLQLHHRHVVRLHGPDGDGRRGIPRHHLPAPDRLQVERQELRQLLRRDRGLEVPRRDARRIARQEGRQSQDRLHGDLPDPGGAAPRQRDHARRQADLPRVHDGHPVHQHLARPGQGARRGSLAVRRRRRRRLHRRRHPGRRRRRRRRRASGRSPTTTPPRARSSAA